MKLSYRHGKGSLAWLIAAALSALSARVYAQQANDVFKLQDCVQFTLKHNPNSTIYSNNVQSATEKIRESRSAFLPTVGGYASFDYNIKLQTSVIPAGAFGTTETKLQIGNKFSSGAYVQADQTIFDRTANMTIRSAKVEKEISDLNVLKENETLIYNTATAYYEVLTYSEKGKLLAKNEEQYKQLLAILKLRYDQGVVKKSEYDRTRVSLNNIQSEIALNDNNHALSLNKLKNTMGLDLNAQLAIKDSVNFSTEIVKPITEELTTTNLLSYRIDQKNILLKEIDIQKKKAAHLPTLSVYAKYGANAYSADISNAFNRWFDYSVVGMKLSIPLFSGFKKSSQIAQSRISTENERLTLKLNNDQYKLDYQNASTKVFSAYTSLVKNKENLDLAKEVLDATAVEYREGTATLTTFLDDDYAYKEAQSNYINALIDYLNSQLAYEKAKGTLTTYIANLQ